MPPIPPRRVLVVLELTEAYAQAILRGVCRRGSQDPRLRLHTTRLYSLQSLPSRLANCDAIIASLVDEDAAKVLLNAEVPLVNVSNRGVDFHPYSVHSDTQGTLERALLHFKTRNIKRLASLGLVADFTQAPVPLKEPFLYAGEIPDGESLRNLDPEAIAFTAKWLREVGFPMGVFCSSDRLALQLTEICERHGISVPQEVAIVGSGNDEVTCLSAHPTLSSVEMHFEEVGVQAVNLLFDILEGRAPAKVRQVVPAGTVMVRQSSNNYAVDDPYVARALQIMDEHVGTNLDIGTLIGMLNISRRMFEQRFQDKMKMSPATYLRHKRLSRAGELLENPEMKITEIAYATGFANAAHFCTLFKKKYGVTPMVYRTQKTLICLT